MICHICNRAAIRPHAVRSLQPRQQLQAENPGACGINSTFFGSVRHGRPHLRWADRALFIWLYRRCPRILAPITIVRPGETRLAVASNGSSLTGDGVSFTARGDRGSPKIAT